MRETEGRCDRIGIVSRTPETRRVHDQQRASCHKSRLKVQQAQTNLEIFKTHGALVNTTNKRVGNSVWQTKDCQQRLGYVPCRRNRRLALAKVAMQASEWQACVEFCTHRSGRHAANRCTDGEQLPSTANQSNMQQRQHGRNPTTETVSLHCVS